MKLISLLFLIIPVNLLAQILNGSFENYSNGKLKNWKICSSSGKNEIVCENGILHTKKNAINLSIALGNDIKRAILVEKGESFVGKFDSPLLYNNLYEFKFKFYSNIENEKLRKITLNVRNNYKCGDTTESPYFRLNGTINYEKEKWQEVSFYFLSSGQENNFVISNSLQQMESSSQIIITDLHCNFIGDIHELYKDSSNLVIDGSFERYYYCPNGFFPGNACSPIWNPNVLLDSINLNNNSIKKVNFQGVFSTSSKYPLSNGSPDIHCSCAKNLVGGDSIIKPVEGSCFGKVIIYNAHEKYDGKTAYGEFLQTKLKTPLVANKTYSVKVSYRKGHGGNNGTNAIGIKFSNIPFTMNEIDLKGKLHDCDILLSNEIITEENKWINGNYTFIAKGGEEYLTLGRFVKEGIENKRIGSGTIYYFIDMITVSEEN